MDIEIDFNIENYNLNEIIDFFKLQENFSLNDILNNETNIINIITQDNNFNIEKKAHFIQFMKQAKNILIKHLKTKIDSIIEEKPYLNDKPLNDKTINQTTTTHIGEYEVILNKETNTIGDILDPSKYLNPIETFNTHIARSNLNSLKRKTIIQTIILNSLFREDYNNTTSHDFTIYLPYQLKNIISLRLSSIQLPNVIYCFSNKKINNIMYISEDNTGLNGVINVPEGNYTLQEFCNVLETSMNEQLEIYPQRFKATANEYTHKITIYNTANTFNINFLKDINSIDFNSTLGWQMGFRNIQYNSSVTYTAESLYNSNVTDYFFFILNDFNNSQSQNIIAMYSNKFISNNILAVIPLNSAKYNICFDNGSNFIEKKRDYFGPINLQKMKIELRDQYGDLLDLNFMDFSFSLEVELGYDI